MDRNQIRKAIFDSADVHAEIVPCPEWGDVKIEVRGLTMAEVRDLPDHDDRLTSLIIASCYLPDSDERVFEEADRDEIGRRASKPIARLATKVNELNGWSDAAELEAELSGEAAAGSDSS